MYRGSSSPPFPPLISSFPIIDFRVFAGGVLIDVSEQINNTISDIYLESNTLKSRI